MPKAKRFTADIEGFEGFPQRLQELIDLLGARQLADKSGVARTTLSSYVDGTAPGMDKLINIVKGSGVSFSWLAFGKGPMFLNEADTPASLLSSQKLHGQPPFQSPPFKLQFCGTGGMNEGAGA